MRKKESMMLLQRQINIERIGGSDTNKVSDPLHFLEYKIVLFGQSMLFIPKELVYVI